MNLSLTPSELGLNIFGIIISAGNIFISIQLVSKQLNSLAASKHIV